APAGPKLTAPTARRRLPGVVHAIGPRQLLGVGSVRRAPRPGSPWTVTVAGSVKDVGSNGLSGPELEAEGPGLRRGGVGIGNEFRVQARAQELSEWQSRGPARRRSSSAITAATAGAPSRGRCLCPGFTRCPSPWMVGTRQGRRFRRLGSQWRWLPPCRTGWRTPSSPPRAAKVRVRGEGLHRARVGQRASFLVATADAPKRSSGCHHRWAEQGAAELSRNGRRLRVFLHTDDAATTWWGFGTATSATFR
uniref:NPCBM domain-containing protein n=1 Tax=Macrostomum lignano TaxID=282301 RepID=A0A1I8FGJ4_9PLAT